jgi:hypothetical protein
MAILLAGPASAHGSRVISRQVEKIALMPEESRVFPLLILVLLRSFLPNHLRHIQSKLRLLVEPSEVDIPPLTQSGISDLTLRSIPRSVTVRGHQAMISDRKRMIVTISGIHSQAVPTVVPMSASSHQELM